MVSFEVISGQTFWSTGGSWFINVYKTGLYHIYKPGFDVPLHQDINCLSVHLSVCYPYNLPGTARIDTSSAQNGANIIYLFQVCYHELMPYSAVVL